MRDGGPGHVGDPGDDRNAGVRMDCAVRDYRPVRWAMSADVSLTEEDLGMLIEALDHHGAHRMLGLRLRLEKAARGDDPDVGRGVELARIVIVKTFDDSADGGAAIYTSYSDGLGLADALGMLAFSQAMTTRTFMGDDDDDD